MSFDGQVLCQRQVIGSCALAIVGRATAATDVAAAPLRNFRRVVAFIALSLVILPLSQLTGQRWPGCTKPPQANSEPHQLHLIPYLRTVASGVLYARRFRAAIAFGNASCDSLWTRKSPRDRG